MFGADLSQEALKNCYDSNSILFNINDCEEYDIILINGIYKMVKRS